MNERRPLFSAGQVPLSAVGRLARINWILVGLLSGLAGVGTLALYSVGDASMTPWAERHVLRFLLALAALISIALLPLELWRRAALPGYLVALGLLALVPLIGSEALGARRWLTYGGLSIQPSELMKVALIAMLAWYYHRIGPERVSRPVHVFAALLIIALPAGLTALQPDLGTAAMLAFIGGGLMLLVGVHIGWFAALAGAVGIAAPAIWANLYDYQRARITVFLDPATDPLGAGYHITQSKIALGSGGFAGKGFLQGSQGQLGFLPERHTDFIFTNFAEEWGFLGGVLVIALFAGVQMVLLFMACRCGAMFGRLLVAGAGLAVFFYAAANMAMVSGLIPVVGIPLPFISYGGTALVTLTVTLGLAMCAYINGRGPEPRR